MTDGGAPSPEDRPVRLFVAFELPVAVRDAIAATVQPWRERFAGARWVRPENFHVTVKFLGPVRPDLLGWVGERVETVAAAHRVIATSLTGLGAFPARRRARVLWMGLDDRAGGMAEIALALDEELAPEFSPESRTFTPHVTVARSDPPLVLPAESPAAPDRSFAVEGLAVFRSDLGNPGPRYEAIGRWNLRSDPL
jgi:2'-5' RNA ligase